MVKEKSRNVVIHPGIFEGQGHFTKLNKMLKQLGYHPRVHACWSEGGQDSVMNSFQIAHSGGFYCRDYQRSKGPKLNFVPNTEKSIRKIIFEFSPKITKDLSAGDLLFSIKKLGLSLAQSLRILYWSKMIRAYVKNRNSKYGSKGDELIIYHPGDGFFNLNSIDTGKTKLKKVEGLHDELMNHPDRFQDIILEHFN